MPIIVAERCTGCGACVEACPTGAMRLADDRAVIAESLCQHCGDCIAACPQQAIVWKPDEERALEVKAIPVAPAAAQPAPVRQEPSRWRVVAGAALSVLGREVLPRAVEWLLARWDEGQRSSLTRSTPDTATTASQAQPKQTQTSVGGSGAQHGHRHRHGKSS